MSQMPELPLRYIPFHEIELCSNKLVDVSIPIAVNDTAVFLVGKGVVPLVWLSAPAEPTSSQWVHVVKESRSSNPAVEVNTDPDAGTVRITLADTVVLTAATLSPNEVIVEQLDLRPLGLAIHGDQSGLHIGTQSLVHNTFKSVMVAFAVGVPHAQQQTNPVTD